MVPLLSSACAVCCPAMTAGTWWRDGVLYQIYPRSFADSDGDGIGDLRGILARLDHLEWLGIDGIWLNPTMPSPNDDWGYDVADYCAVHPDLGTLADLDALVAAAGERGIRVLLDLVPNHSSDAHEWFVDAASGRGARHRDYYVWADPATGRRPAEQLEVELRRLRVAAARADRPVLPEQLPAQPAGPQLVERRRARGVRRRAAVLVRARDRRLPDRRLPRDRQGPRAARRSGADARGPSADPPAEPQAGVLDEPARGPRRAAALACARRRAGAPAGAGGRDLRARPRLADPLLRRGRGRAPARVQLPLRALRARGRGDAQRRRGHGGEAPGGVLAGVHRIEPRRGPAHHPLGGRRRAARARSRC